MDDEERALERAWQAAPDDQTIVAALIQARRRAGKPVGRALLRRQRSPERTWNAPFVSTASVIAGDEGEVRVGETPSASDLLIPAHERFLVRTRPEADSAMGPLIDHLIATGVEAVALDCENLTDGGLSALGRHRAVRDLTLTWMQRISDSGLRWLSTLTRLEAITLENGERLTGAALRALGTLERLTDVELSWVAAEVRDDDLAPILDLPALGCLTFIPHRSCVGVTDRLFDGLRHRELLESLDLSSLPSLTDAGLRSLDQPLRRISFSSLPGIGWSGLLPFATPLLESLSLARMDLGDDVRWLEGASKLHSLSLRDVRHRVSLTPLAHLPLKRVTLSGAWFDPDDLRHLPPDVQHVDLWYVPLTERSVAGLARLPALRSLYVRGCELPNSGCLRTLGEAPALRQLQLIDLDVPGVPFSCFENIEDLIVEDLPLQDEDLRTISRLEGLKRLWILSAALDVSNDALLSLAGLSQLESLMIMRDAAMPANLAAALRAALPTGCELQV